MVALDTNTISYFMRGVESVASALRALPPSQVCVPSVVIYELRYGLARMPEAAANPRLAALTQFLLPLRVLPFDEQAAAAAAQIRRDLERQGQPIGPHDVLIAATALANGAALVTRNIREFQRVPGLQTINWQEP